MAKAQQHSNVDVAQKDIVAQQEIGLSKMEMSAAIQTFHRGPIPSPEVLQEYDKICPGAADRIISMAENQSAHRQKLESQVVNSQITNSRWGIILAFCIGTITIIAGAVTAIMSSSPWAGSILGGAGVGGLVGTFIYGTNSNKNERQEKEDIKKKNTYN